MEKDFLYKFSEKLYIRFIQKDKSGKLLSAQVKENMGKLYPASEALEIKKYYVRKISLSFLVILVGLLLTVALLLMNILNPVLKNNQIRREEYGGNTQEIPLKVSVGGGESRKMVLEVKERIYDEEQLKRLYHAAIKELETVICGENENLAQVETDLNLVSELPEYPFHIEWECQNYGLINTDGKINTNKIPKEGVQTGLTAVLSYEDFRAEYIFYIQILPKHLSPKEQEEKMLQEVLQTADAATKNEELFSLPAEIEGKALEWEIQGSREWLLVLFLTIVISVMIYLLKDEDLKKEIKKKEDEMRLEYPAVVSKLSIYLGAGMSVRRAWEKIAGDYEKKGKQQKKSSIYEEMGIVCQEIKSGIAEMTAYDNFGKRCGIQVYRKLSALLVQNIRKGGVSLVQSLKEESRIAFEERKNAARKAGEEAGTKMLLPMMMMLCVVMMMILLPVFMSF